ncbi:MAG: replication-associated recombination protein A [Candidatus Borkfalkiaceae bacterium]|nr:replication-associated recombination protein A [Clostridia bacterium]MDY6223242.1 replication-associated recombination protein A [Christensenellaceae bacterium]
MDLFDLNNFEETAKPLAERMRANNLNEFIGQKHLVAEGSLLRRAIASDRLGSCIFYGPPGCGKTTLAHIIAMTTNGEFIKLNAVNSGVADVKKAVDQARETLRMYGRRTYLMLDECHRFSKTQSDSLLPAIEKGTIIFIGSTTENPYAAMTPAIVSRCRVFEFKRLSEEEIAQALKDALKNRLKGLGRLNAEADEDAIKHIARVAGGDLRMAYNALELAVTTTQKDADGVIRVRLADAEQSIQQKALSFGEDAYYDYLSAFCKSLRGSDANAALYYANRIIEGGGDPMLIARRLVVHSAEDVGLADPRALQMTAAAMYALEKIGYPEAMIPLSEAIIYVCEAEKSNSVVTALNAAKEDVKNARDDEGVPAYLRDNSYGSKEDKAASRAYKYPHDYGGYVEQQYLPDSVKDHVYYVPKQNGYEAEILSRRERRKKK